MDKKKLKDHNILLVEEKGSGELKAVASINKDGKMEMVAATAESADQFLTFNRNNDAELKGIMSDFLKEKENPGNYRLFQVPAGKFEKLKDGLEEVLSLPNHPDAKKALQPYEVNPTDVIVKQTLDDLKVLLTPGEDGKLKAVSGMNEDGTLNTVNPTKENSDKFFEINSNGNLLDNFMQKFSGQYETPSHTGLYAVAANAVEKISAFLDKIIQVNPDDKVLAPYKVKPDGEGRQQEQSQGKYQPLDLNKVDWKEAEKLGISGNDLRDALKAMAYGHKSPGLVDIKANIDGEEISVKARLSLEKQPDGSIKIQTHPKQEQPDFLKPFMGVKFSDEDIKQFQQTGNGGRVFDLEREPGGEKVPSLVSLDKLTNRFEAMAVADINIPQTLKNAQLSQEQQEVLKRGEGTLVEGMDKRVKPGEEPSKIDRIIQYNAANRNFDFRFTPEQREQHRQERAAKQEQGGEELKNRKVGDIWVRPVQGGVQLPPEKFKELCDGKAVWMEGMQKQQAKPKEGAEQQVEATDKKGQKYNAWVWIDTEKGHVRHTSKHPDQMRAIEAKQAAKEGQNVKPAEGHKTQVAVNNDGKTNETTKHAQGKGEALKSGQTNPTAKQDKKKKESQQQKQSPAAPKKGKGKGIGGL